MTAINLIVRPAGAYLLTDRAGCTADGVMRQMKSKIVVSSQLCLAIGHTGISAPGTDDCKAHWLASQANQKDAIAGLPDLLRELVALNEHELALPGASQAAGNMPCVLTLAVAVWSAEFDRAGGCVLTSGRGHLPDRVPEFTVWPTGQYIQPTVPHNLSPGQSWRADRDALPLIEAQRRIPSPWGTNHIGGGVDLAVVDRAGAQLRSLHTWPDKVGELIRV